MDAPTITTFVVKFVVTPNGVLERILEVRWEEGATSVPLGLQRFRVAVRPSGLGGWTNVTVKGAHMTRVAARAVKSDLGPQTYEARVARLHSDGRTVWSQVATASARPPSQARSSEVQESGEKTRQVPASARVPDVTSAEAPPRIVTCQMRAEAGARVIDAGWIVPDAIRRSPGLEFEVNVKPEGSAVPWAVARTRKTSYRARTSADRRRLILRVRAVIRGTPGPWSAIERAVLADLPEAERASPSDDESDSQLGSPAALHDLRSALGRDLGELHRRLSLHAHFASLLQARAAEAEPEPTGEEPKALTRREMRASRASMPHVAEGQGEVFAMGLELQRLDREVETLNARLADEQASRRELERLLDRLSERLERLERSESEPGLLAARQSAAPWKPDFAAQSPRRADSLSPAHVSGAKVPALISSERYRERVTRAGRMAPDGRTAWLLLSALVERDWMPPDELATAVKMGADQLRGSLAALRRLLNIDGYEVLRVSDTEVSVDWALAAEQFQLGIAEAHRVT
ncbi:MAG TPA: hypothetical protein DHV14_11215 [Micrococcales bacterium]|uniref:hypothetical protein n=1 Tax=Miniimonas arenae TaxID=676201 RepID=UPI000EEFA309|nr:hypothetical protein [Miniimonas arenae]HCX85682.1 hypothetical protein [Micrococcales bacterium]